MGHSTLRVVYTVPADNLLELNKTQNQPVDQQIAEGFVIKNGDTLCSVSDLSQRPLENIGSQQFLMQFDCKRELETLSIDYRLFLERFPDHENLTRISIAGRNQNVTFSYEKQHHEVPVTQLLSLWKKTLTDNSFVGEPSISVPSTEEPKQSAHYFPIVLEHILFGFDHVLFLIGLLLLPLGLHQLLILATTFTIAHSVTLAVSVLDIVTLPSVYVEAAIAFSIVCIALKNLWKLRSKDATNTSQQPTSGLEILKQRYARGEINHEELEMKNIALTSLLAIPTLAQSAGSPRDDTTEMPVTGMMGGNQGGMSMVGNWQLMMQ